MKLLCFAILTTLSNSVYGQNSLKSLRSYYTHINKAELAIVDGNHIKANEEYTTAFKYKYPHSEDLYNAFLSAYYSHDSATAISRLNFLAYKGLEKAYFTDSLFSPTFYKYVFSGFDSAYSAGEKVKPVKLIAKLDKIYWADQQVRNDEKATDEMMSKVDSENMVQLLNVIKEHGFPNFERIGFWTVRSSPLRLSPVFLILWHQRYHEKTILDSILLVSVMNGEMRPCNWAATVIHKKVSRDYLIKTWDISNDTTMENISLVNIRRTKIFLENYQDYKKKWDFQMKHPYPSSYYGLIPEVMTPSLNYIKYEQSQMNGK